MLTDLSQEVANCYLRAAECAERAGTCKNAEMREFYIEREKAWIKLARSYQFSERLARQFGELKSKRLRDWPATAHRVRNCPSCKVETTVSCFGLVICPNCQRIVDQVV